MSAPETPECDKLVAAAPVSNKIGDFLDWLQDEYDIQLYQHYEYWNMDYGDLCDECIEEIDGNYEPDDDDFKLCREIHHYIVDEGYAPVHYNPEKWLAKYFDINLDKVEEERRAILDHLRNEAA